MLIWQTLNLDFKLYSGNDNPQFASKCLARMFQDVPTSKIMLNNIINWIQNPFLWVCQFFQKWVSSWNNFQFENTINIWLIIIVQTLLLKPIFYLQFYKLWYNRFLALFSTTILISFFLLNYLHPLYQF